MQLEPNTNPSSKPYTYQVARWQSLKLAEKNAIVLLFG